MIDHAVAPKLTRLIDHPKPSQDFVDARNRKRYRDEAIFKYVGLGAIIVAVGLLALLFTTIIAQGSSAFFQTKIELDIEFAQEVIDPEATGDIDVIRKANFQKLVSDALYARFPDVSDRRERRALRGMMSSGAALELRDLVVADPSLIGTTERITLLASADIDQFYKGKILRELEEDDRRVKDNQIAWHDAFAGEDRVKSEFNTRLFTYGDSREPELAGIAGALMGSFYMMLVTLLFSAPLAVAAAVYLEEFAAKNRITDAIEVNINNLAAVPSIVFGLLGLAVFLNLFGMPRSAPLVGGLTLTLMTLPTIVVATRASLRSVPPSIREAALGIGASKLQTVTHHVLPLALPGILTGTIIGMAQALGETAPLLMIGMIAFIVDVPGSPLDPATALPVQIYLWADSPERAFTERTSAAIMVLIGFLIVMNAVAVIVRKRFERTW